MITFSVTPFSQVSRWSLPTSTIFGANCYKYIKQFEVEMSLSKIKNSIQRMRDKIQGVEDIQLKTAMKYQFILGATKAEVAGKHYPLGDDVQKTQLTYDNSTYNIVIFKINRIKNKNLPAYSILPLDKDFDPWVQEVFSYMGKFGNTPPFEFKNRTVGTNEKHYMKKCKETFKDLPKVRALEYYKRKKLEEEVEVTSKHIQYYRLLDLIYNYNFNFYDLAYFGSWNYAGYTFKAEIQLIKEEDLSSYSESELIDRAVHYFNKLLKKNEIREELNFPLSQAECYFIVYCYFEIREGREKEEIIPEIARLLGKPAEEVESLLQYTAFFDNSSNDTKPFAPLQSNSRLIREMYEWYESDINQARNEFDNFCNVLGVGDNTYNHNMESIRRSTEDTFTEEGSIYFTTIKLRKRSQLLVNEARRQFREADPEKKLRCHACGFAKSDLIKNEIVHIHHKIPLKDISEESKKIDLSQIIKHVFPLCPTCHSIAHSRKEPLSLEEIKKLL